MAKNNSKVPDSVRRFAKQDIKAILDKVNKFSSNNKDNLDASLVDLKFNSHGDTVDVTAIINYNSGDSRKQTEYHLTYTFEGDDVWLEYNNNAHARWLYSDLCNPSSDKFSKDISAASKLGRRPIMAADDEDPSFDEFEDEDFGRDFDDDNFQDTLDEMADNIEDMQDDLDEVQEDDVDIEVENNIEGHYIAECDRCHGIFISAMVQSDQDVEKMSGVCPLCQKESDQYFRWVVQAIE